MAIAAAEFHFVADLVRREAAIVLEPGKEYLVETRLTPLARAAGLRDTGAFVRQVRHGGGPARRREIVEALTTNETSWFRDMAVFDAVRTHVLPKLVDARSAYEPLRIWSAAASTGQEAYSLAMLVDEELGPNRGYQILGTDISRPVIDRAREGRYSQMEMNRGLPARHLVRYFTRTGAGWQIDASLQRNVTFRELNLAVPFVGLPHFDIVFLRNVLIYFDLTTKQTILRRLRQVMAPNGWLVLGTAETTRGIDAGFELSRLGGLSAYQVTGSATNAPTAMSRGA
jgi:chemotaxis protein methyltransferase CheR